MTIKHFAIFLLIATLLPTSVLALPTVAENAPTHITVAQPITNVIGGIVAVQTVNQASDLASLSSTDVKPAAALLNIAENLNVTTTEGTAITTLAAFLSNTNNTILPVLRVEDAVTADSLVTFLDRISFYDVIVMSSDANLVKEIREKLPLAYAAIDFTETLKDKTELTKELCLSIRHTVWENRANIAYLPSHLRNADMLDYLYHRQVTVWLDADNVDPYEAILSGAVGLVSSDTATILDIACNKLPEHTMTRSPLIIGHRGISKAPENTIEGAMLAYEFGCDSVELDIMLTGDGEIVICHDDWTGRTCNENLFIPETPLAQLKELYANVGFENDPRFAECRIPTLREFLATFQGTDNQITIEIKTTDPAIVPPMCDLLREMDMISQCNVISFWPEQLVATHAIAPEIPLGYLCDNSLSYVNLEYSIRQLRELTGPINATFNPGGEQDSVKTFLLNCRGISSHNWTFAGSISNHAKPFLYGVASLTTDDSSILTNKGYRAELTALIPTTIKVGDTFEPSYLLRHFGGTTSTQADRLSCTVFEDEEAISVNGNALTFEKPGTYTLMLMAGVRLGFLSYEVPLSLPLTVTVEGNPMTEPVTPIGTEVIPAVTTEEAQNDDTSLMTLLPALGIGAVVFLAVAITILPLLRKKH